MPYAPSFHKCSLSWAHVNILRDIKGRGNSVCSDKETEAHSREGLAHGFKVKEWRDQLGGRLSFQAGYVLMLESKHRPWSWRKGKGVGQCLTLHDIMVPSDESGLRPT